MKPYLFILACCFSQIASAFQTNFADSLYNLALQKSPQEGLKLMLDSYYPVFNKSYPDGIEWSEKCLEFAQKNKFLIEEGRANLNLGVVHYLSGNYEKAISHYQSALDIFEKEGDKCYIGRTCNEMSVYYRKQKMYDKSLASLDRSFQACSDCGDFECVETSYNNRGVVYEMMGDYAAAIKSYRKAETIALNNQNDIGLSYIYNNLSGVYLLKDMNDSVIYYFEKSTAIRRALNDIQGLAINHNNLGEYYLSTGELDSANSQFNLALNLNKSIGFLDLEKHIYSQLFELHKQKGNLDTAIYYLEKSNGIRDSLLSSEKLKALSEMEVRYETEKVEKEFLKEQQKRTDAELTISNRNNWIFGIAGISLVTILASILFVQRKKRLANEERNRAVLKEKERGMAAVFDATEKERQRIAKDLHDSVGQQMSGLKMAWETITLELKTKDPENADKLSELSLVLDQAADEVREISHQMMPKTLEEFGLPLALKEMLDKSLKFSKIEHEFEEFNIQGRFDNRIELSLYRISQELVNNVIKHSGASKLSLQLFQNQNQLILIVEDNGAGFKTEHQEGHGLLNIKSRLNTINGLVNYEATTETGTIATVRVNLDSHQITSS